MGHSDKKSHYTTAARRMDRILNCIVVVITVMMIIPFLWIILMSFKTDSEILTTPFSLPEQFSLDNYKRALDILPLGSMYLNTMIIAFFSEAICLAATFMSSYGLTRLKYRSSKLQNGLYLYIISGLMIPTYILLFPIYRINVILKLTGTYTALILPLAASSISFNTLMFVGFLKSFPSELEEAAVIDGCGLIRLCWSVVMPLMKPIMATVVIFNVLYVWNEYPLSVTLIQAPAMRTISMVVSMFRGAYSIDYSGLVAGTIIILIPQLIFYGIFQKYIVGGQTAGAVKG